jgi:hypothetical protein
MVLFNPAPPAVVDTVTQESSATTAANGPPDVRPPAEPPPLLTDIPDGCLLTHLATAMTAQAALNKTGKTPSVSYTVVHFAIRPQVFGLRQDGALSVRIKQRLLTLMDGGANICITGDLSILLGIVDIPPMPITVATSGDVSLEDCCT